MLPSPAFPPQVRRLLCALGAVAAATVAASAPRPPNILFCISDDQSYPHASAYGCTWVRTPAFDRVAHAGLLFTNAYTPNAKCGPSRSCVLTGRNSWQLEAAANHVASYPAGYRTFMEALAQHGYATGHTGKGWAPGDPGVIDGRPRELTGPAFSSITALPPAKGISRTDYAANFEAFLRQKPADRPFCFWYGGHEPHRGYEYGSGRAQGGKQLTDIDRVPAYWPDNETVRTDLLDYAFEIEHFDRHLGRMLAALERTGELAHTIVVVTSDNGMPFPRAKGASYEISHHLPLAIMWPDGIAQPGRVIDDLVSFIDFAPTFLEVAGVALDASGMAPIAGRSLAEFFYVPAAGSLRHPPRAFLLLGQERHDVGRPDDVGYPVRGIVQDGFLYLRNFEPSRWPMCDPVTGYLNTDGSPTKALILAANRVGVNHWQWVLDFGRRPAEELYDLRADPDCIHNLALEPLHTARRETMREQLFGELRAQEDPRMHGDGAVFDRYPYAGPERDLYRRRQHGEKVPANWTDRSDCERPGFDPESPLSPPVLTPGLPTKP